MKKEWRDYWEERPLQTEDPVCLSHGKVARLFHSAATWHERRLVESLSPGADWVILDAGCGAGDDIVRFHNRVRWMVGVDFSVGMMKRCVKRLATLGIDNASLVVADVRSLPFRESSFDGSLCMGVLLFLKGTEVQDALSELSRVTVKTIFLHGKNSLSPFGLELRIAEMLRKRVRERDPHDYHRPIHWYRRRFARLGRLSKGFTIGVWIPQMPARAKNLVGSVEVLLSSIGLNHPFGKEYYATVEKRSS